MNREFFRDEAIDHYMRNIVRVENFDGSDKEGIRSMVLDRSAAPDQGLKSSRRDRDAMACIYTCQRECRKHKGSH